MYELSGIIIITFFPFLISFYFYQLYNGEKGKNWLDFFNDVTDYIVFNENLYIDYNEYIEQEGRIEKEEEEEIKKEEKVAIIEPKYEEKYIDLFYLNNTDLDLTEEEEIQKVFFLQEEQDKWETQWKSIHSEIEFWKEESNKNKETNLEEWKTDIQKNIVLLEKKKDELVHLEEKRNEQALQQVYTKRLEKLKNSFIMEKTPLGNVVLYYNVNRESFEYYSDNTIPYRFLEVIARKYVITFKCRFIYVIMEEELKKYEKKLEQLEIQKKIQEENRKTNPNSLPPKKNIFATFKSYNKESGSGRVVKAPPPKNSIPNKLNNKKEKEKIILKENANRYTYVGRFSNFSPLKKIERKEVDKKYSISFADFKKLQL